MRIAFATPIFLLLSSTALGQVPAWHVSEVSGDVRIVEGGQAHPAARGALVPGGAIVATAPGARAVLVRARDYVVVSPASRIRVPTFQQQGGSGLVQMITDAGTAMFRIQHTSVPHFGVQTPYLAAVVKGTVFTVTVGEHGASVQVTEGAVQVSTVDGGAADMIRPGMVATIRAGDLQLLHVEGETSHDLRSNGVPSAGVATVPAAEAGHYEGPAETRVAVEASIHEEPISLADATGGLVAGSMGGGDRVAAEVHDIVRSNAGEGGGSSNNGNHSSAGGSSSSGSNAGNSSGGANAGGSGSSNAGSGNSNAGGSGGTNAGSGGSNSGSGGSGGSGSGGSNAGSSGSSNGGTGTGSSTGSGGSSGSSNGGTGTGTGTGTGSGGSGGSDGGSTGGSSSGSNSGHGSGSGGLNVCLGQLICAGLRPH